MKEFEQAYRDHREAVSRFAVRCVGRRDVAEDIASEAFLALYRNLDRVELSQLPAWLLAVVRNLAANYWRHAAIERRYADSLPKSEPRAEFPLENWLFNSRRLKHVHRVCLILRYVHGMERREIADRIGLSETQVKGHLQYARRLLKKELVGCADDLAFSRPTYRSRA